jgi:hypothetical protein
MYVFGPGALIVRQTGVAIPQAINIGYAQKISYEEKANVVSLYGQNRRALASAGGTIKGTVKVTAAKFDLRALSIAYSNQDAIAGATLLALDESHAVPSSPGPYTVTLTPPGSGTYLSDWGVKYSATGVSLSRVSSVSAAGEYSVNTSTGVYTFDASDADAVMKITYDYTVSTGKNVTIINEQLGSTAPVECAIRVFDPTTNTASLLTLHRVVFASLNVFQTDLEKFSMPELEGEAFVNAADQAYTWSFPND